MALGVIRFAGFKASCQGELNIGRVTSGVPQGSVLRPTLFSIYINDIDENISAHVRLFADDTVLYQTIRSKTDTRLLQKDLDTLEKWKKNLAYEC